MKNKIKGLTNKERLAVEEFKNLLLKSSSFRITRIVLFGSKARDDSNRNSDIDLLIVVNKNGKSVRREIVELTHEPILHFEALLSPLIVEEGFFKEWSPLLKHIEENGVTLWMSKKVKKNM